MPSPPPTVKTARNGDYLYIYEKVNNLYTRPGQMYEGDLYDFRLLTTDDGTNVLVYDSNGNEIPTKKLEFGGKRRRTTHRKARKRGGNKKSCKRTKKR
jgi:hypothetical protein